MSEKLEAAIKREIRVDDGREMPEMKGIMWTLDVQEGQVSLDRRRSIDCPTCSAAARRQPAPDTAADRRRARRSRAPPLTAHARPPPARRRFVHSPLILFPAEVPTSVLN